MRRLSHTSHELLSKLRAIKNHYHLHQSQLSCKGCIMRIYTLIFFFLFSTITPTLAMASYPPLCNVVKVKEHHKIPALKQKMLRSRLLFYRQTPLRWLA